MMNLEQISIILLGFVMCVFSILAIESKKLIKGVVFLSLLSMLSVVGFVMMKALDVAVTEAIIGSGLVTILFIFTLLGIKGNNSKGGDEKCEESLL